MTAIEIIIAVAVLLIVSAVCVKPLAGLMHRLKIQNAADGMKHYILNARLRAVSNPDRHCGVVFRFHPGNTWDDTLFAFLDRNPPDKLYVQGQDSTYLAPLVIQKQDKIAITIPAGYPSVVTFRGDGSASGSAKIALSLKGFQDTLDLLASTGRVKVTKH